MVKSNIQLIKEWIEKCNLLNGGKINVDYLKENIGSYSIDQTPSTPIVKKYKDGCKVKQITFDFSVQAPISSKAIINLANSKFCEDFMKWVEEQNDLDNLPQIDGIREVTCTSPRIFITKNEYYSNLYNTNELSI